MSGITKLLGLVVLAGLAAPQTGAEPQRGDVAAAPPSRVATGALPAAKPGQCFAKVRKPAQYKTVSEKVRTKDASHKVEIVPARYEWANEKVVSKDASFKLVEVPAVYETVKETVEVAPARQIWRSGHGRKAAEAGTSVVAAALTAGLPAKAEAGQCFREFHQAARYKTEEQKVVSREASQRIEVTPPRYEWINEKVLVKEASERIVEVPAVYETQTEKVLDTPAHSVWKKGAGPAQRVDHATGEIMCLVEIPATYKTVRKRVLKTPATTRKETIPAKYEMVRRRKLVKPASEKRIEIPAKYLTVKKQVQVGKEAVSWRAEGAAAGAAAAAAGKATGSVLCRAAVPAKKRTLTRQVLKTPASVKKVEIPAQYKTVRVRKLAQPAAQKRIDIPAKFATVERRVKIANEELDWEPVLCQTNTTRKLITQIQQSLKKAGADPGPIDGVLGSQTMAAVSAFQRNKGLARGGLTLKTLSALGVEPGN